MRLLDRYLLRELCIPLAYCLAGFLIFWISFDLFSELEEFQRVHLSASEIGRYYMIRLPDLLVTVLPVALLLGLLYALTKHGRHNEIIAMRASGLSLWRVSVPYLLVGALLSLVLLYLNEALVPRSAERAEAIKRGRAAAEAQGHWIGRVDLRNASEKRIWNMANFNTATFEMVEPQVEWLLPDGTRKQLMAKRGGWEGDHWVFYDAELFSYPPHLDFEKTALIPIRTNKMVLPELSDKPREIKLQLRFQRMNAIDASKRTQLSLSEIEYLRGHVELNKRDRALLETQFQARLAQPWTCLVVVLVAVPLAAGTTSRRNVFVGVASSIFIVFIYFIILRFGLALGTGGYVPPAVAAWAPNVLFAAAGAALGWKSS